MQEVFSKASDPRNLLVWKIGFKGWQRAEDMPELAELIYKPPPLPKTPDQFISPETTAPVAKPREWKWHLLQGTLQVLIMSGVAVSDVFWQWTPNKTLAVLLGFGAAWILTVALPRKLGRKLAIRGIAVPIVVLGLGLLTYKYATLGMENDIEGLTGRTRSAFVESSLAACLKSKPGNISTSKITEYCNCYASALADKVSNNELISLGKKDQSTWLVTMQPKIDAAADACSSR
jgi:hypothetical protein